MNKQVLAVGVGAAVLAAGYFGYREVEQLGDQRAAAAHWQTINTYCTDCHSAAERAGETSRARALLQQVNDTALVPYAQAQYFLSASPRKLSVQDIAEWLRDNRDLSVADRVYRLAVAHSTKKVRRHRKTVIVAVVTNIPAPSGVGARTELLVLERRQFSAGEAKPAAAVQAHRDGLARPVERP